MTHQPQINRIEYAEPLHPVFTIPKRIKIVFGGRGSTKSTGIADYVLDRVAHGKLWCCGRESQNSIDESVHRNLVSEISRLKLQGFTVGARGITHVSGGRIFYVGLAVNVLSLKSMLTGVDGLWVEEGEGVTRNSLEVATGSVRLSPEDTDRKIAGEHVDMPEIIITMNRGSSSSAISEKYFKSAKKELERCGYYEDDTVMIVRMNYTDVPQIWFKNSGLEDERRDDYEKMSRAEYDHKWLGAAFDEVAGSIIKPEWYDACVDAHLIPRLKEVFRPHGAVITAHDPFDDGNDAGGFARRHGSIITHVKSLDKGEIDDVCDWATDTAINLGTDWFIWDGDGMGTGLKRQVQIAFKGTKTEYHIHKGSLSGKAQDNATRPYLHSDDDKDKKNRKTYMQTYLNNRAQYYGELARRVYNTYRCVIKEHFVDPDDMISFASDGLENPDGFRSEICKIPRKRNGTGLYQIMSKVDMKKLDIPSPNECDSVTMTLYMPPINKIQETFYIPNQKRI